MHNPNAEAFFVAALVTAALSNRLDTYDRLSRRARAAEQRLTEANNRIRLAANQFESLAQGFDAQRIPSKAAAVRAMAHMMGAPL
jgi:hypothetical protein